MIMERPARTDGKPRGPSALAVLLAVVALLPAPAAGRKTASAWARLQAQESARKLVQSGEQSQRAGDLAAARKAFADAYRSHASPEILCLLGALAAVKKQLLDAKDLSRS